MKTFTKHLNFLFVILFFIILLLLSLILLYTIDEPNDGSCYNGQYECLSVNSSIHICIPKEFVCDKKEDCPLKDDEADCDDYHGFSNIYYNSGNDSSSKNEIDINMTDPNGPVKIYCHFNVTLDFDCQNNNIISIPQNLPESILKINLNNNSIVNLNKESFKKYENLERLMIANNKIEVLPKDVFFYINKLKILFLYQNYVSILPDKLLSNLTTLEVLNLRKNKFKYINLFDLENLQKLWFLDLSNNQLTLDDQKFPKLKNLNYLDLGNNQIQVIKFSLFKNLHNLTILNLQNNLIHRIYSNTFSNNVALKDLYLNKNKLDDEQLNNLNLNDLVKLKSCDLSYNNINYLPSNLFQNNSQLSSLKLKGLIIYNISLDHFIHLKNLTFIYFSHFRYCMYVPTVKTCSPYSDFLSSLKSLLAIPFLRILVWLLGIPIMILNLIVLLLRSKKNHQNIILSTYVKLLSISDFFIGFYMIAIGWYDYKLGDKYQAVALDFVQSWKCTGLGALAVFSKQFSLFIVLLISKDRYLSITIPYFQISSFYSILLVLFFLFSSLFIAAFPVVLAVIRNNNVYFNANVLCYPLHLTEPYLLGWQFNAFVNIAINLPVVSLIIYLYSNMYMLIKKDRRLSRPVMNYTSSRSNISQHQSDLIDQSINNSTNLDSSKDETLKITSSKEPYFFKKKITSINSEDRALAIRFFFIVFTECICWLPVILIKILAMTKINIPPILNAWIIIFILPFNCIINPIIYTIAAPKRLSKLFKTSCSSIKKKFSKFYIFGKNRRRSSGNLENKSLNQFYQTNLNSPLNSSQITMICINRKTSKDNEKIEFTSCDINNNKNGYKIQNSITNV